MTAVALFIVLVALVCHTAGQVFLKHAMASTHTTASESALKLVTVLP